MNTWYQLLTMAGFSVEELSPNQLCIARESRENTEYLSEVLSFLGLGYSIDSNILELPIDPVDNGKWIQALRTVGQQNSELSMTSDRIALRELDVEIAGLITQLNRLGFPTTFSCSGHSERFPKISFCHDTDTGKLGQLFKYLNIYYSCITKSDKDYMLLCDTDRLPPIALKCSTISKENIACLEDLINQQKYDLLETLLNIPGTSQQEDQIRDFIYNYLPERVDHISIDDYGNLLAHKKYGHGGVTVLLSAHMDIYDELIPGSRILKENGRWSKDKGILGADDRAGVAMILLLIDELAFSNFNGTIKIIFTVEEEIGLAGARKVNPMFLWDVDYAIMLDRRNSGDLVTHSVGTRYASELYGKYFSRIAYEMGLGHVYRPCCGGSSDLRVWSSHGVDSINISIGFYNEHSDNEYLVIKEWEQTMALVRNGICRLRELVNDKQDNKMRWGRNRQREHTTG